MNADVENKLDEFMRALEVVNASRTAYLKAVGEAKEKSEELSAALENIINQPHIRIDDYEIDA